MIARRIEDTAHGDHVTRDTKSTGVRGLWRVLNAPLGADPRAMRIACTVFLLAYGIIAIVRYHESQAFFWLRFAVCAYAVFGIWLSRRMTRASSRAYTIGVGILLPLQGAYIDGMLGNHLPEVALTALATFAPLVFLQAGIDVVLVVIVLTVGHVAVLSVAPAPAVPYETIAFLIGGALAVGASAGLQTLIYRGRWAESIAASAEWKNRYETAILASGQLLYDWDPSHDDVRFAGASERMLGYAAAEIAGPLARWNALVHPEDLPGFTREIDHVLTDRVPFDMSYRVRRKDGEYVIVESHGYFVTNEQGGIARMIGFLTDVTERRRVEAERTEEAAVSAALARVGRELISSLETPVVLERLCRLTTEVLECDFSATWLRNADENVYTAIASYGFEAEQLDAMKLLRLPANTDGALFRKLTEDDIVHVTRDNPRYTVVASVLTYYGIESVLCVALRRAGEIVAVHAAGHHTGVERFTAAHERIGLGIGRLASMALTNATLVEELERAGRLKSEFVSTMSHELRTPLNVILGYTDMLGDELVTDHQRMLLGRVRTSSLELLEMIEATLNLNRLATGQDLPRIEALPLASLWDDLRTEYDALPRSTDVALRWENVGDTVLHTDRRKLKMILKNLIGNARKFTPRGEIVVACEHRDDGTVLSVRDTGIGIPAEHVPLIFKMFRQVDSSDRRSYGGAGLGLYIVDQLVTQLGGTIQVESEAGRGSVFRVGLPAAADLAGGADPAVDAA
jgi:PAS domain S-box-containing protein